MRTTADSFKVVIKLEAATSYLWADAFMAIRRDTPALERLALPGTVALCGWVTDASHRLVALSQYIQGGALPQLPFAQFDVLRDAWSEIIRQAAQAAADEAVTLHPTPVIQQVRACLVAMEPFCTRPDETYGNG